MKNSYTYRLKHSNSINTALELLSRAHNIWWRNDCYFWHKSPIPTVPGGTDCFNSQNVCCFPALSRGAPGLPHHRTMYQAWTLLGKWETNPTIRLQHALEMQDGGHVCHHLRLQFTPDKQRGPAAYKSLHCYHSLGLRQTLEDEGREQDWGDRLGWGCEAVSKFDCRSVVQLEHYQKWRPGWAIAQWSSAYLAHRGSRSG